MSLTVGIDVAKATLSIYVLPHKQHLTLPNTAAGHAQLLEHINGQAVDNLLLEATGGYERALMRALSQAGLAVTRVNPRRARAFAEALGKIAKTDPIDAQVLAHMAGLVKAPGQVVTPEREALRVWVQRREQLVQQRDDERRRLKQAELAPLRQDLLDSIKHLNRRILTINNTIAQAQSALDDALGRRLRAVRGIGQVTSASLLAYLPELGPLTRKQICALAGLAPYNVDSGKHAGKRRIRGGRAPIRRVLYMACLSVIRQQPDFKARYERLRQRGKCAKVAIVACMRVLLSRLNAMARDQTEWKMASS
ncbi:transposase [Luteimonas sp. BDR2-5]|uniref:IS110 family transposase n=1 Tax=Proluteimonas luteida TaxID=2878685 RepID=UPI001E5C365F|nr:transposase [Luteimonas sp. BDR2-5]MCD9027101.1 transposase [Luteimonas sp. BDR2-5]